MESIGNEVGQKMRSAVKAKLMELGCYVDDELPDYIMVMVANKRTRSQMETDLNLFLSDHTEEFVNWIQQVLKKLREVRLTNPELYACSSFGELKRKASIEMVECVIKKEKHLKLEKNDTFPPNKSLTDEIPVNATKLCEKRIVTKIIHEQETSSLPEDNFDIPSISEVNMLEDSELDVVATKIKEARKVLMKSDSEDDDFINMNTDADEDLMTSELYDIASMQSENKTVNKLLNNRKITDIKLEKCSNLGDLRQNLIDRRKSPSRSVTKENDAAKKRTISLTEMLREEQEISGKIFKKNLNENDPKKEIPPKKGKRESVHSRLGIPSTIIKPKKTEQEMEQNKSGEHVVKAVPSVVKVKPRRPAAGFLQANKTLLLKAVAEAQRSVAQAPIRGSETQKPRPLYTKKYKEKLKTEEVTPEKNSEDDGLLKKCKNIIIQVQSKTNDENPQKLEAINNSEYVPMPTKKPLENRLGQPEYIPTNIDNDLNYEDDYTKYSEDIEENSLQSNTESNGNEIIEPETTHQFIVTLDGIKNSRFKTEISPTSNVGEIPKSTAKRPPSPIIFDKNDPETSQTKIIRNIPEVLPKVPIPSSLKSKERCKYWPLCKLGDTCDYIHPSTPCKMFPMCKFGDHCLYIHPKCKFYLSCTRKDCLYSHGSVRSSPKSVIKSLSYHSPLLPLSKETCKFFPNCINPNCIYYHPPTTLKPCKFGFACLHKNECTFSHNIPSKEKLTWHSVK